MMRTMESVVEGPPNEGISLAVNGLSLDSTWNSNQSSNNNQNILYIQVGYVKDDFKADPDATLSPQQSFNDFKQHVSPLDPNMSSVACYSPVYMSDANVAYTNPIVVTHLVANNGSEPSTPLSLSNNSSDLSQVVPTRFLQMVDEQSSRDTAPNVSLQHVPETEQEVELLITDQNTVISYSVSTQEYLVERCLTDEQQLLEDLSPETLLDSNLLALDENTLKSQLPEIIIEPVNQAERDPLGPLLKTENIKCESDYAKNDDLRRSIRQVAMQHSSEEQLLSCAHTITDKPVLTRARATLPEMYLTINELSNSEYGVFARKVIPKCTQFGPLEGTYANLNTIKIEEDKLDLLVEDDSGKAVRLDISDESKSNWMCFVRRATDYNEQNLVLIEQDSSLYYFTTKPILPKQELMVGYGKSYAGKFNLQFLEPTSDDEDLWHCFECPEKFSSSEQFQKHLETHDNTNVESYRPKKKKRKFIPSRCLKPDDYECSVCAEIFHNVKISVLKKHLMAHNFDESVLVEDKFKIIKSWQCTECSVTFNTQELLNTHFEEHTSGQNEADKFENVHVCKACSIKFNCKDDLEMHVRQRHPRNDKDREKSFKCPICHKVFASTERIQRHMLVHGSNESKPFKCDKCNKRFLNNSALTCHKKTHLTGRKQFECPICRESFHHVLQLKVHVPQHCHDGQYTCPHCSKLFSKYSIIRKHIRAFHCEERHSCPHCSKQFKTSDKLRMHLLNHSDHREFLCADCGKQFKRRDKLKEHCKRMHSEERENAAPKPIKNGNSVQPLKKFTPKVEPTDYNRFIYKCHTCLIGFKRRGMLVNHLAKRHPDISPTSVPELNLPILRATRDYYCQYCDKVYKSSSKRKAHILKNHPGFDLPLSNRRHASTSDFPNPTFSQTVGNVTTHPQACQWCHKQYASKAKLLQHQRKKHTELLHLQNDDKSLPHQIERVDLKVTDEEIFAHLYQDYQIVSMDTFAQSTETDSRLYRLLTTTNNLVPPR